MTYMLEARDLHKYFGALHVTNGVNLKLAPGARHALIGPNGAGKTTLVGQLSGVIAPTSGQVFIGGEDVTRLAPAKRTRMGLVRTFQISNLFTDMTVLENVYLAVSQNRRMGVNPFRAAGRDKDSIDRAMDLIRKVRLEPHADRLVSELAYGQQRLIEIAIALALDPKILLLDEPAAGIPTGELDLLLRVIEELDPSLALLIIEHDMELVRRVATDVTVLVHGTVLIDGPLREVMSSDEVKRVYLGGGEVEAQNA
ncbi:MAG: ABC transporter ATP-binding protein [Maritimibacter sp.]|uniref:ABC transporter ATP-binding protein n=1 Tax=Maritimibacter sp. TaxID=2003363 RepID=UPI001DB502C3|nr:ABC transporter ATP-binding protein [Maritimibacter sp.]MBL6426743.1 ABC transporter ATP-binding protein [Maritimibacter sp.]